MDPQLVQSSLEQSQRVGDEVVDLGLELLLALDQLVVLLLLVGNLLLDVAAETFGLEK